MVAVVMHHTEGQHY